MDQWKWSNFSVCSGFVWLLFHPCLQSCYLNCSAELLNVMPVPGCRMLPATPERRGCLCQLLWGMKKMCLLQQWCGVSFDFSFCNRGHGCRKVLFASSIYRKEVWVFQCTIFILTAVILPSSLLFFFQHAWAGCGVCLNLYGSAGYWVRFLVCLLQMEKLLIY